MLALIMVVYWGFEVHHHALRSLLLLVLPPELRRRRSHRHRQWRILVVGVSSLLLHHVQVLVDRILAVPFALPHLFDMAVASLHELLGHQNVVVVAATLSCTQLIERLGTTRLQVVEVSPVVIGRDVSQKDGTARAYLGVVEEKAGQPVADVLNRCVGLVRNAVAELRAARYHLAIVIEHLRLQNVDLVRMLPAATIVAASSCPCPRACL